MAADAVAKGAEAVEKAKATAGPTFTFGGATFALAAEVDVRVVVAAQRGNLARALELALADPADLDRLLACDEPLSMARFGEILDAWSVAVAGGDLGESAASSA